MGVTSEGACNMPEHMKRREAVYYFRRVVPKDLQAAGEPREVCRSLKTRDFSWYAGGIARMFVSVELKS